MRGERDVPLFAPLQVELREDHLSRERSPERSERAFEAGDDRLEKGVGSVTSDAGSTGSVTTISVREAL